VTVARTEVLRREEDVLGAKSVAEGVVREMPYPQGFWAGGFLGIAFVRGLLGVRKSLSLCSLCVSDGYRTFAVSRSQQEVL